MISALLLAVAGLSTPAAATFPAYGADTVRALKGHAALPKGATQARTASTANTCHPEPTKGRTCRHLARQAKQDRTAAPVFAEATAITAGESMQ